MEKPRFLHAGFYCMWSHGMVMFILLNPDLQYPYQLEIYKLHQKTYEMCKNEVLCLLAIKQLPTFSNKFSRFQATSWLILENVFEKCADFDPTKRPEASGLVEMFHPKEGPVCREIPLVVNQSSVVEQHDYLVAEGAIGISNVISTDATNSCSSLSVLITERILVERQTDDLLSLNAALDEWQFFSENVSNVVLTMPDRFNRYRNIERLYESVRETVRKNRMSCLRKSSPLPACLPRKEEVHSSWPWKNLPNLTK